MIRAEQLREREDPMNDQQRQTLGPWTLGERRSGHHDSKVQVGHHGKAGPFASEGRYGARARNRGGFGAGAAMRGHRLMRWLLLASHLGPLSTRGITGSLPSPAIYVHRLDSHRRAADSARQVTVRGDTIDGHPRTSTDNHF